MTDEHYIRMALREATKAFDSGEVPVGAVIVQDGQVLARAYNQVETLNDPTAHAEILALTSAFNRLGSKYLPDASIYITVEPCLMCAGALYWSKIGRIVYGTADEKNGYRRHCSAHAGPASLPAPEDFRSRADIRHPGTGVGVSDISGASSAPVPPSATPGRLPEPWPFHPRTTLTSGVLAEECAALMKEFFRSRR